MIENDPATMSEIGLFDLRTVLGFQVTNIKANLVNQIKETKS